MSHANPRQVARTRGKSPPAGGTARTVSEAGPGKGISAVMRVRGMEREPTEFAEFYEATRDDCLRIVLLNVGDRHLAHDLVAEAYTSPPGRWPGKPMATSRSLSAS